MKQRKSISPPMMLLIGILAGSALDSLMRIIRVLVLQHPIPMWTLTILMLLITFIFIVNLVLLPRCLLYIRKSHPKLFVAGCFLFAFAVISFIGETIHEIGDAIALS